MNHWLTRFSGVLAAASVVWILAAPASTLHSQSVQTDSADEGGSDLKVLSSVLPTGIQQIVVVEANGRTMAVYHVEPTQGKIQLKSVRKLSWDLNMEQFNGQAPLPSELKLVQP